MRDVEYLRDSMGAPLEYSPEHRGFFYTEDSYVLPSLIVSEGEKRALSGLAVAYSGMGTAAGAKLAALFQRLSENRKAEEIPVVPLETGERAVYTALTDAILGRYAVRFAYANAQSGPEERDVSPYKVFRSASANYAVGYCRLRSGIRVFRLDKIGDLRRAGTPYYRDPGFREDQYGGTAPFDYAQPYTARILPDPAADPAALKHSFSRLPGGGIQVEFKDPALLLAALLGQGGQFEILEPAWLREKLGEKISAVAKKNFGWDIICHTPPPIIPPSRIKEGVMGKKIIEGADMRGTWTSYVAAAEACLRTADLWKGETWKAMGLSGMGFHFIVHKDLCPSSVTVYDWNYEHLAAMDRMGVHSESFGVMFDARDNTFAAARERAVGRIRESIDRGVPVLAWAPTPIPEFGVIKGYDDGDRVFFAEQCNGQPADPLLYDNLGKTSDVPILAYQVFYQRVPVEDERSVRQSLEFGLSEWNKEFHMDAAHYASGKKGYANFIAALEKGSFNPFGIGYLIAVYADSKGAVSRFLGWAADLPNGGKPLARAAKLYGQVSSAWAELGKLVPFQGPGAKPVPPEGKTVSGALKLVKEACALEGEAMEEIAKLVKS